MAENEFPIAEVRATRQSSATRWSWMWLVTLVCVIVAVSLVWWSLDAPSHKILIHFPEGHGLKTGDAVRHRGIEIGRVESVQLNPSLAGIDVSVGLDSSAAATIVLWLYLWRSGAGGAKFRNSQLELGFPVGNN